MKWYKRLYLGENAKKKKYNIWAKIRKNKLLSDAYFITLSSNEGNLFDIIKANYYYQPHFKKTIYKENIYIVGLACGYDEAVEVVRNIVEEVYSATGGTNVREYLRFGTKNR